jgi:hypothetical protein
MIFLPVRFATACERSPWCELPLLAARSTLIISDGQFGCLLSTRVLWPRRGMQCQLVDRLLRLDLRRSQNLGEVTPTS